MSKVDVTLPRIALTMGDPAGVGPEITLKAALDSIVREICQPILFGDASVWKAVAEKLGLKIPTDILNLDEWDKIESNSDPLIYDFQSITLAEFEPGQINSLTGDASFKYFSNAIELAKAGKIAGIATGPIHKEALNQAGHPYPGHTEILADLCETENFCMMLTSKPISCSFVTTHVGLCDVPGLINRDRVLQTIRLTHDALKKMRKRDVRLVCCGLNPHAGEGGLFGRQEEEREIVPAIQAAQSEGIQIEGPLPADTAFVSSKRAETDGYICMYHDQGGIPLKALAFDEAVNVTLGLPIVRTSVDHGTACDIAWQGIANHQSMVEAIRLAAELSDRSNSVFSP